MGEGVNSYNDIANTEDLTSFVALYGPLIKRIANHIKCKLPDNIELDDLIQAGLIGLLEARNKFSMDGGASFETYASIKIRGAIIDELRRNTGITRDISQNIKNISAARSAVENNCQDGKIISSKAIATEMGITEKKYTHIMTEINAYNSVSMSSSDQAEEVVCPKSADPADLVESDSIRCSIKMLISSLPKREQHILALYYNEQLNFKEIADILGLTEARISQLHSLSLEKIRRKYSHN